MKLLALELHDAGLLVVGPEEGPRSAPSPGYALLEGGELTVGADALDRARLAPRGVHHRFWEQLGTDAALPRPFPPGWRTADLAHAHLEAVWQPFAGQADEVLLVTPATYDPRRLGLVLGIARSLGMPVTGLADLPVAAVASAGPSAGTARVLHLDLHLHRAVATEVLVDAGEAVRGRVRHTAGAGRVRLGELWAEHVAGRFVRTTRFDPRYDAASDQLLHRRLPQWLSALAEREAVEAALPSPGGEVAVELTRRDAAAALEPVRRVFRDLLRQALDGAGSAGAGAVALSAHLAGLPGLRCELREELDGASGATVLELPEGAPGRGALAAREAVRVPSAGHADQRGGLGADRAGGVPLVTRLPLQETSSAPPDAAAGETPVARRSERRLCLLLHEEGHLVVEAVDGGLTVDGEPLDGRAVLRPGSRLRLGDSGEELVVIAAPEPGGGEG